MRPYRAVLNNWLFAVAITQQVQKLFTTRAASPRVLQGLWLSRGASHNTLRVRTEEASLCSLGLLTGLGGAGGSLAAGRPHEQASQTVLLSSPAPLLKF